MRTLLLFLSLSVAASAQSFQRQSLSNTYVNPAATLDSLTNYHWDVHNYGPDSVSIMVNVPRSRDSSYTVADSAHRITVYFRADSVYPAIPPGGTVNYNFSLDSARIAPVWEAVPSSASVFYRIYK